MRRQNAGVWMVLLLLTVLFLWQNVFKLMPAIPLDLLYQYHPWRSAVASTQPNHNFELSDQVFQFYPWNRLIIEELKSGRFPLWNPFAFCGSPLFANGQSGVLFPLNLLNLIFGQLTASLLLECARLFIAAIFTWAFLRQLGLCRSASVFGAVVFAFSRNMIVWLGFPAANAAILLPALFWATERLIQRPSMMRALVGALLIAFQFLAGQPQTSLACFFGVSLYLFFRLCAGGHLWGGRLRIAGFYAGAWLLGISLSAIQLLPLLEYMKGSAAFVFRSQTNLKVYPWYEFVSFIVPDFFGTPYQGNYWGFANLLGTACYLGIGPLILALMSLPSIFRKAGLTPFWALALICLGIAYRVPGIDSVLRLPLFSAIDTNKFLVLIVFSLAVCAALELDMIVGKEESRIFKKGLIAFALLLLFAVFTRIALNDFVTALNLQSYEAGNFAVLLLFACLSFAAIFMHGRGLLGKTGICWALLAISYADLYLAGHIYNAAAPRQELPATPAAIQMLPKDVAQYRVVGTFDILPPNTSILYGLADARGYDAMTPMRYFNFLSRSQSGYADFLATLGPADSIPKESPITRSTLFMRDMARRLNTPGAGLRDLLKKAFYWNTNLDGLIRSDRLGMFSVKYVLAAPGIKKIPESTMRRIGDDGASVFENPNSLPRCFIRHEFDITGENGALQAATQPDFDYRNRLLLSGISNETPLRSLGDGQRMDPRIQEHAEIVRQTSSSVELAVNASAPAVVVLNDLFAPGWEAYVDGDKVEVYQANYLFRAVAVKRAGSHTVLFQYRPRSFRWGAWITLSTLSLFCIAFCLSAAKRLKSRY